MIAFDLRCDDCSHVFEVWFRSSGDYESQKSAGFLECPTCGSHAIQKGIMAPNIGAKSNQKPDMPKALSQKIDDPESTSASQKPSLAKSEAAANTVKAQTPSPKSDDAAASALQSAEAVAKAAAFFKAVRDHVVKTHENVGKDFADTARKMHYGEEEERGIYGDASTQDLQDLNDEGIDVLPLPDIDKLIQ